MRERKTYAKEVLFIVLCLSLVLVISVVGAKELTFWGNRLFIESYNDWMQKTVEKWGKENGVDIHIEMIGGADWPTKLATAVEVEAMPDVLFTDSIFVLNYQSIGIWEDMSDIYREVNEAWGGFTPGAAAQTGFDGKFVGVPFFNFLPFWYMRQDWIKEVGAVLPETWDELIAVAKKVQESKPGIWGVGYPIVKYGDTGTLWRSQMWSFGGYVFDETGSKVILNSRETLSALELLRKMYFEDRIIPPGVASWDGGSNNRAYLTGQVMAIMDPPSELWEMKTRNQDLLERTALIPALAGPAGRVGPPSAVQLMTISSNSKNKELAESLVRYLYSKEVYSELFGPAVLGGYAAPVLTGTFSLPVFVEDPYANFLVEAATLSKWYEFPAPMSPQAIWVSNNWVLERMLIDVIVNQTEPEKALEKTEKEILKGLEELS